MYLNIKLRASKNTKAYNCQFISFKFDRLMIFDGGKEVVIFRKHEIEWYTVG